MPAAGAAKGVTVDVRTNIDRVMVEIRGLREDLENKATYRALNRAIDKVATETGREIRKTYNVRQRAITSALTKRRATSKSLFASLIVEGLRLGLIEFDARWRPGQRIGATVKIKVAGGRKPVRGAFIAASTANNATGGGSMGMRQVFRRVGRARHPIRSLRSLSVPQAFSNQAVLAALEVFAEDAFNKNFVQQIRYLSGAR